jgi:GNAT superfamily N-acetyltransferase
LTKELYKLSCLDNDNNEKSSLNFTIWREADNSIQGNISLETVYTKEEYRGKGFASKLIAYLKGIATSENKRTGISVYIHPMSEDIIFDDLIAFYDKNSFIITIIDDTEALGSWPKKVKC